MRLYQGDCFSDKAGVFVGSSIVVPPVFLSFLRVYHVHLIFVCFLSLPSSSSSAFITSSFLLRICVYICLFFFFLTFFFLLFFFFDLLLFLEVSCEKGFSPFLILIFALGAMVSKCISESFGRSGYIPCRIGKDGGFIRRDRSFHLPRINPAKVGRCVTDTLL